MPCAHHRDARGLEQQIGGADQVSLHFDIRKKKRKTQRRGQSTHVSTQLFLKPAEQEVGTETPVGDIKEAFACEGAWVIVVDGVLNLAGHGPRQHFGEIQMPNHVNSRYLVPLRR